MRTFCVILLINLWTTPALHAQFTLPNPRQQDAIQSLINNYSKARENRDTTLLKHILTNDIDQLVSTGEWRSGITAAVQGMLKSSATSPGTRTLNIEKIRMISAKCALVDCRYEIQNSDTAARRMWSTFLVVLDKNAWKITAIRNMLPAPQ